MMLSAPFTDKETGSERLRDFPEGAICFASLKNIFVNN